MKLFVEIKGNIYNFETDAIEEGTVPGGEYRRGVASTYQVSAVGGNRPKE